MLMPSLALLAVFASAPQIESAAPSTRRAWLLTLAPSLQTNYDFETEAKPTGLGFRFGLLAARWAGRDQQFFIAAGPSIRHGHATALAEGTRMHQFSLNADLLLGGGNERFTVYWHLAAGHGYISTWNIHSDVGEFPAGVIASSGLGGFVEVDEHVAIGTLVDVNWIGVGEWSSLGVEAMITIAVHLPRRGL